MSSSSAGNCNDQSLLPPFLEKLQLIVKTVDPAIASWSEDGQEFQVHSDRFESEVIATHFKGTRKTFIRQLHFYGFRKGQSIGEFWTFAHPNFVRDQPEQIHEIRRKTRTNCNDAVSRPEFERLQARLEEHEIDSAQEISALRSQVSLLTKLVADLQKPRQPLFHSFPQQTYPEGHIPPPPPQNFYSPEYFQQPNYQFQLLSNTKTNTNTNTNTNVNPTLFQEKRGTKRKLKDKILNFERNEEGQSLLEFDNCFGQGDSFVASYLPFDDVSVDNFFQRPTK